MKMAENRQKSSKVKDGIVGLAVADALGVPVEFRSRKVLELCPVEWMRGYGSHNQAPGTWSDDTSLTLCLLDSLSSGTLDLEDIMDKFVQWKNLGKYTPNRKVFDIGIGTSEAILRYLQGIDPILCGGVGEYSKGNGSLMRILPMVFYEEKKWGARGHTAEVLEDVHQVSALTHGHPCCQVACGLYVEIGRRLLEEQEIRKAILGALEATRKHYIADERYKNMLTQYGRLYCSEGEEGQQEKLDQFQQLPREEIRSSGYVVDTLEAAIWCLLTTNNYRECVLKAVNLGDDTDTVAAVTGGLAGIVYKREHIPRVWLTELEKISYIEEICEKYEKGIEEAKEV